MIADITSPFTRSWLELSHSSCTNLASSLAHDTISALYPHDQVHSKLINASEKHT